MVKKLGINQISLCDDSKVIFTEDHIRNNALLNRLPYIFHDPHSMDKKVDVKKLQFGSKIDKSEAKREELFNVKNVIAPDKIELNNGLIIRLLGVKPNLQYQDKAIKFLKEKISEKKSFFEI